MTSTNEIWHDLKEKEMYTGKWRCHNQKLMLTYKGHLDKFDYITWFEKTFFKPKFIRLAHEVGESNPDVPYDHTHVLLDFGKRFDSKDCHVFNYWTDQANKTMANQIHPNIKFIITSTHWDRSLNYIAKEDPENADLKKENKWFNLAKECNTLAEAMEKCVQKPTDAAGVKLMYETLHQEKKKEPEPLVLRPWQQEIYETIHRCWTRKVYWFYDKKGAAGKSTFATWLKRTFPEKVLLLTQIGGEYHLGTVLQTVFKTRPDIDTVIVDLPRGAQDKRIYGGLECLKNGAITALKYNGIDLDFNKCHVIVMANFLPDFKEMSEDRWAIFSINNNIAVDTTPPLSSTTDESKSPDSSITMHS